MPGNEDYRSYPSHMSPETWDLTELEQKSLSDQEIERQLKEAERRILSKLMESSDDKNVQKAFEEAAMITKLVHSEELEKGLAKKRKSLEDHQKQIQDRINANKERLSLRKILDALADFPGKDDPDDLNAPR